MGNRAVIVSHDTTLENSVYKTGIYVHWCGNKDDVVAWLNEAKAKGIRTIDDDPTYFWARFCQIICNNFSSSQDEDRLSVGIGPVSQLDYYNFDNGVYYIDSNFEIVKHTDGSELDRDLKGARDLFNFYKQGNAGSFHTGLLDAWAKADDHNRERLSIAFPELALAIIDSTEEEITDKEIE